MSVRARARLNEETERTVEGGEVGEPSQEEESERRGSSGADVEVAGATDELRASSPLPLLALPLLSFGFLPADFSLEGPGSVLEALTVLAVIVTVHEAGHFLAATWQGIHVTKFSIGFGPVLAKFQGKGRDGSAEGGVEYALRAIPLGGYVAFPDDDPSEEARYPPDDPNLLKNRPLFDRALVISAGVIANVIFAYALLFTQVNTVGIIEQRYSLGVRVPEVVVGSAGERAGLQSGDLIVAVDGRRLNAADSAVSELVASIRAAPGREIRLDVVRDAAESAGATAATTVTAPDVAAAAQEASAGDFGVPGKRIVSLNVVPDVSLRDGSGRIGVQLTPNAIQTQQRAESLTDGAFEAAREFNRLLGAVTDGLQQIVFNFGQTADRVSGPVAIVAVGAEVARTNLSGLFQFAAIVNLNLAVVNILPLPALDGGYLLLLLVEAVRGGKKIPTEVERGIMSSGLLALLGTGIFLIVKDTINLGILPDRL